MSITADKVAKYLPSNYQVIWSGKSDWHYSTLSAWQCYLGMVDDVVVIEGIDSYGWTLDTYGRQMLVDEDGISKGLEPNVMASLMTHGLYLGSILGDALVLSGTACWRDTDADQ